MILNGARIKVGHGYATVLPNMDFETYSSAGYVYDDELGRFRGIMKSGKMWKGGLKVVGLPAYAEHPSTEVLSLSYDLKDGLGVRQWLPGMAPPLDLFAHIAAGKVIEAHNSMFEYMIWRYVCCRRMGWPPLPLELMRDSMAKCKAWSIPGKLEKAGDALDLAVRKDPAGKALMKLSVPRKPTKADDGNRYTREKYPEEFTGFDRYNVQDSVAESALSEAVPDLRPEELELWLIDQRINARGVHIDRAALSNCIAIVEQAFTYYNDELVRLTGGTVGAASELAKLQGWLGAQGVNLSNMQDETVTKALERTDLPPQARRALEIRSAIGSASIKKAFALDRMLSSDGRMRDLFRFCGADRTGRFAGAGPQPQNMPNSGPKVRKCDGCGLVHYEGLDSCPGCGGQSYHPVDWGVGAVESALHCIASRDLRTVEMYWDDAVAAVSGCLRGLFTAAPGHDLICSDYSAIEAVVAAWLAGEEWRLEVFRTHGKIYEMGASKISGVPFEEILAHKETTGDHHPLRKKIGKVSELASGYGGWIGAWVNFGADKFLTEDEIKQGILAWREASPNIVEMWGGQHRKDPDRWKFTPELFGLEGAVVQAIQHPGQYFGHRGIWYGVLDDVLYCRLPSGRLLNYHAPRLTPHNTMRGPEYAISYMGYNTDYTKGPIGWVRLETYSGKLFENLVQAVARDVLTHAMVNLEAAGYPIVLHVHDEVVAEVPEGFGSVEEVERIMGTMPEWASDLPVKAAGGWRGLRYRKD